MEVEPGKPETALPEQSVVAYTVKVTLPVGVPNPPEIVAVSVAEPPMVIAPELETWVVTVGVGLFTVRVNVPELPPEYVAVMVCEPDPKAVGVKPTEHAPLARVHWPLTGAKV